MTPSNRSSSRPGLVKLTLDARPGPAERLTALEEELLVEAAVRRADGERAARPPRKLRAAMAVVIVGVALSGGAAASYVAIKQLTTPALMLEIDVTPRPRPATVARVTAARPVKAPPPIVIESPAPIHIEGYFDALEAAGRLRRQGAFRRAHAAYLRIADAAPRSSDGMTASLAVATLELDQLGRPREALRRFERLSQVAPRALAEEAAWGVAESQRKLGDRRGEARAVRSFLARFPASMLRARAEDRLAVIDAGEGRP